MQPYAAIDEANLLILPLEGPSAERSSQLSGLAWCGDMLILLPQYPAFPSRGGGGQLFALPKSAILAAIQTPNLNPLKPVPIKMDAPDFSSSLSGFEGYEAIAFGQGEDSLNAWVAIEVEPEVGSAYGLILRGRMGAGCVSFSIDTTMSRIIPSQSGVGNMAEEALVRIGLNTLLSFHEANSVTGRPGGVAHCLSTDSMLPCGVLELPEFPYRITDATDQDKSGAFWVINMFYPGEEELLVETDWIAQRFGMGHSHLRHRKVERLLELTPDADKINYSARSTPLYLPLTDPLLESRNWEGIARLDSLGLLLVTDTYPETILAFVPFQ